MPNEALMEERLGGDATPIEACPPDVTPLDDCNGETLSSGKDRRQISRGSTANDNEVCLLGRRFHNVTLFPSFFPFTPSLSLLGERDGYEDSDYSL
jgi:hypothetical protein